MSSRTSLNEYERTPIPPPTATTMKTTDGYDEISEKHSRIAPKVRVFFRSIINIIAISCDK